MHASRRRVPRRVLAALLAGVIAALIAVDHRQKQTESPGFIPEGATWYCYVADWPTCWTQLAENNLWHETRPQLLPAMRTAELRVFRAAGVRPTPRRFRLYLGRSLLVASTGDAYGICVKPGVFVRTALALKRLVTRSASNDVLESGSVFLAMRDGFLIASESRHFVDAALRGGALVLAQRARPNSCQFVVLNPDGQPPRLQLSLDPAPGLPVNGLLRTDLPTTGCGYSLDAVPPIPAIAFMSCGSFQHLGACARALIAMAPHLTALEPMRLFIAAASDAFLQPLIGGLSDWASIPDRPLSVMWTGLQTESVLPVPAVGLRATRLTGDSLHPLAPMLEAADAMPHEWDSASGSLAPWLGAAMTICLAQDQALWLAASTEPLMAQLASAPPPSPDSNQHQLLLEIDWTKAAEALRGAAAQWSTLELAPQAGRAATYQQTAGWADALQNLRATRVYGSFVPEGFQFEGILNDSGNEPS